MATQAHRGHTHTLHIWQLRHHSPPLESPVRCLTSPPRPPPHTQCSPGPGARPTWSCPQRPKEGEARTLWVGNRLPGGCPTLLGIHSPKLNPAPPRPSPAPMGSGQCLPSPQVPPAHLPEVHPSHTFKRPHLPELLPTEGMPASSQGVCPSVSPSPFTCQRDPGPHLLPSPLSYSPPLLAVQPLSLPKLSCCRGVVLGGPGPSEAWVRGTRGWGGGAWVRLREREARQAGERERETEAGRQPAGFISLPY